MTALLKVRNLKVGFRQDGQRVAAVKGVSFDVERGETVALVGESGSGKSVTALSTVSLLGGSAEVEGSVTYDGREMVHADDKTLRQIRGNDISFIFQEPMTSLNPLHTLEKQLRESMELHQQVTGAEARARIIDLLNKVGIRDPEDRLTAYPHQLSGGQRQRVMIAMALACRPKLIVADEATTALDVTTQAQILDLLRQLQVETGAAMIFVTHDLGVVAEIADRVAVMYSGRIVEVATADALFEAPRHPYTRGLMACRLHVATPSAGRLAAIEGVVPPPSARPAGCAFAPRCPKAEAVCANRPALLGVGAAQAVACHSIGPAR